MKFMTHYELVNIFFIPDCLRFTLRKFVLLELFLVVGL